jgi:hypothetical protein
LFSEGRPGLFFGIGSSWPAFIAALDLPSAVPSSDDRPLRRGFGAAGEASAAAESVLFLGRPRFFWGCWFSASCSTSSLLCGDALDAVGGRPRLRFTAPAAAVDAALGGYRDLTVSAADIDLAV